MKRSVCLLALLLFLRPLSAQDLSQRVSLQISAIPLEEVLLEISERYQLRFSYGNHPRALQAHIVLEVSEMPLERALSLLLEQAGLTYKVIGGTVVLRKQEVSESPVPTGAQTSPLPLDGRTTIESAGRHSDSKNLPTLQALPADMDPALPEIAWRLPVLVQHKVKGQVLSAKQLSAYKLGPVFSLDLPQFSLESDYPLNQEVLPHLGFSAGLAGYRELRRGLETELLLLYRTKGYTLRYLHNRADVPMGIPVKTDVALAYLELPLGLHMGLFQRRQLQVLGTLGVSGSFLLDSREATWLDDGRMFNTGTMQMHSLSHFLWGIRGGAQLSYSMTRRVLLFAAPAYQYTGNELKGGTQRIRQMELSIRSGLQFRL